MSERPILFHSELIPLIFGCVKTQTRRVLLPQNSSDTMCEISHGVWGAAEDSRRWHCPYGQAGDRLWVRETYALLSDGDKTGVCYRADGEEQIDRSAGEHWISSRFMPRKYCRLILQLQFVRVEKLQDISPADAHREGCHIDMPQAPIAAYYGQVAKFHHLWDSINAKRGYGWDVNPWVWVLDFRLAEVNRIGG